MKLSSFLFIISASLSTNVNGLEQGNAIKGVLEQEIANHRSLVTALKSRNYDIRKLQDTTDCDAAYLALYEDATLSEAGATWRQNFETQMATADISACTTITDTSSSCDFSTDPDGTQEFQDVCTGAGGTPTSFQADIACTATGEGQTISFSLNFPDIWDCFPTDCEEEISGVSTQISAYLQTELESAFSSDGYDAACDVGDDVAPPGGAMALGKVLSMTISVVIMTAALLAM